MEKVIPKYTPMKCVNCNGFGTTGYEKKQCPACKGTGVLLIENVIINDGGMDAHVTSETPNKK